MIEPSVGYVLVQDIEEETKIGNIYVPSSSDIKKGRVHSTMNGNYMKGDIVLYPSSASVDIVDNGDIYKFIKLEYILGKVVK